MYLKSISLKGFKSFVDRTKLEFGPGVSVIVGPNGSGKSNVTDAVLWALGEQSPMAVRGQSMQDVIFGGAPGRQAATAAEVELVLDDAEGRLGLGPEISIVRRLDRSGEGEYRLAGARCRLVDVIELLSDTGLGKEMHSVISQGRVESIVTSKPRDRRLLIEEAAGLGKHRKRRRRAQLKLARTQANLDRALDVEREARSRLRPLKRQAEAAELHERIERQRLQARWELERDDLRIGLANLEQARAEAAAARERRERLEAELREVSARRDRAEQALTARSAQREELSRRCFSARAAADRLADRTQAISKSASRGQQQLDRARELYAALDAEPAPPSHEQAAAPRIAVLEEELAALERDREAEIARQLGELEEQLQSADEGLARHAGVLEDAKATRERRDAELERARVVLREAERAVESSRQEAARVGAELAAVNQFLSSHQAPSGGARALSEDLEVQPGFELALAAALDGRLRAVVVRDRAAAQALLDRSGADGGRALVAGGGSDSLHSGAPPTPEAVPLVDRLRGDQRSLELARALLRDTWIVDELDQLPSDFGGIAVTRGGRVWSAPTRELRQAAAVGDERVLAERNRREQLVADSERAVQTEQAAKHELAEAAAQLAALGAERERALDAHRAAVRLRDEASEERRRIDAQIEHRRGQPDGGEGAGRRAQLRAELTAERAIAERAERERAAREQRIAALQASIVRDETLLPILAALLESLAGAADAIETQRSSFDAALAADREAGEHVAAQLRQCAQEEAALHSRLHGENEELTTLEVRAQRTRDQAEEAEQSLKELASALELPAAPASEALSAEQREALVARLQRLARRREQLGPVNPLAQQEYAEALEHVEELERQRADLESALRELEKLIADTDRQIRETFEGTFQAAARNFEQLAGQLFPGGHGRLSLVREQERQARVLGAQPAPEDPHAAAAEHEEPEEEQFSEEDLMGVEIEITPAGKEMKRLSLLSGGEKSMTALAFLFAVFLAKPCPFYILDEVEAALDDLNIDRFLELLRQYSTRAQFIVVTHQKRTMEAADSLYGVSMAADGISKVVSRRLPPQALAA